MKKLVVLCLPFMMGGCVGIGGMIVTSGVTGAMAGSAFAPARPVPETMCTSPGSIAVAYYEAGPDSERETAMQRVADHCGGDYAETRTVDRGLWHIVEARCVGPETSADPPCAWDEQGVTGFGEQAAAFP